MRINHNYTYIPSLFFFNFILFNFTILYWFCHISKWICHRYTCVPHPEPSSLLPPHTIPLDGNNNPVYETAKETLMYKTVFWTLGEGEDDLGEWHWNMYNIIYEMSHQSRFDARYWMLGAGALGRPTGMVWGGRREEGSGWGTHVYLWQIHFDIWQNQYNIVKLNKIK